MTLLKVGDEVEWVGWWRDGAYSDSISDKASNIGLRERELVISATSLGKYQYRLTHKENFKQHVLNEDYSFMSCYEQEVRLKRPPKEIDLNDYL